MNTLIVKFVRLVFAVCILFNLVVYGSTENAVVIQKCCKELEILIDNKCHLANESDKTVWEPSFLNEHRNHKPEITLKIGVPKCGPLPPWPVYHGDHDRLVHLDDGTLRHYALKDPSELTEDLSELKHSYDYDLGTYCTDKKVDGSKKMESIFALVCAPEVKEVWQETDFILRKIVDPIFHANAIICYMAVAVIHFVLPQLRDLVGNIITSIAVCMVIVQAADLVRIFSMSEVHVSYIVADITMFISLLSAYFWITLLGFYIWKTFRSRNVFLRITDGRKYCYYSFVVWIATICMSLLALFAHFMLDTEKDTGATSGHVISSMTQPTAMGWLGMAVFFSPIAFSLLMDIYFYITTMQILSRMTMYGRIHHKLKYCFETYIKLFLVMSLCWVTFLLSLLPYNGMYYCYIISNGIEAPLILYISVLRQRKVRYLLKKTCCYEKCVCPCFRPNPSHDIPEWGEEMMSMNL